MAEKLKASTIIFERFNMVMKNLFDNHKTDKLPSEQADILAGMKADVRNFIDTQKPKPPTKERQLFCAKIWA
jgi:hypothetical protein